MWIKVFLLCALTLFTVQLVSARWCTRLKSVKSVQTYMEYTQCNQSYEADCGWFTSTKCTHYELVDCHKQHNRTIVRYKIVEECCKGYQLDPMNISCIEISGGVDKDSVHYYESDDNLLWGLSHGAYAGIICSLLFILCVIILVLFRLRKRNRNARLKAAKNTMEMDMREKMIT